MYENHTIPREKKKLKRKPTSFQDIQTWTNMQPGVAYK